MKNCGTMFNTAHPIQDSNGDLWNLGATMLTGCKYHLVKIGVIGSGKASDGNYNQFSLVSSLMIFLAVFYYCNHLLNFLVLQI